MLLVIFKYKSKEKNNVRNHCCSNGYCVITIHSGSSMRIVMGCLQKITMEIALFLGLSAFIVALAILFAIPAFMLYIVHKESKNLK